MRALLTCLSLLLCLMSAPAQAILEPVEEGLEAMRLIVRVDAQGRGHVSGRECEDCPERRFEVTHATRYTRDGVDVGVAELRAHNGEPATIIYNLKSGLATRILW